MATELPPLELQAELVYPDGSTTRWDRDAREAKDQPTGITLRSKRYTGFADAQLSLARRGDIDYPDLGLLDGLNLIGHDGSVAYEGRIATMPRSLQTDWTVGVQAQGWMSHAKDEPFTEIYVDRDLGKWSAMSAARRAELLAANYTLTDGNQLTDDSGGPVLELTFQGAWATPFKPRSELLWHPQPGIILSGLYYKLAEARGINFADPEWNLRASVQSSDQANETGTAIAEASAGYIGGIGPAAKLEMYYQKTATGTPDATYLAHLALLAVYGNHALTRRGTDPGGFYVSDMMRDIATRFAPKLDTSGILDTTFAVPHASFTDETFPYDSWQALNTYHRWEMDVFEKRRLNYYPIDLTDWDWEIRLSDPGVKSDLQGDDTSNLCNGVIVRYQDLDTGYQTRLSPDDFGELRDLSPNNPANETGSRLFTTLTLSVPTHKEGALQIGRAYLGEFNQSQAPGSITVQGHIRDRAGHWQQGWKVRSSDRLVIADFPNDRVRVVGETEWNHDTKTLTIAVDSSIKRLDAILARLGVAVEAANLNLP